MPIQSFLLIVVIWPIKNKAIFSALFGCTRFNLNRVNLRFNSGEDRNTKYKFAEILIY